MCAILISRTPGAPALYLRPFVLRQSTPTAGSGGGSLSPASNTGECNSK